MSFRHTHKQKKEDASGILFVNVLFIYDLTILIWLYDLIAAQITPKQLKRFLLWLALILLHAQ
ncbi:hypothetical protein BBM44_08770 [Vibrio parahaemolyticus]|nr:hypothetical protein BBM44_08770 [Vibrio parahaemolyticus]